MFILLKKILHSKKLIDAYRRGQLSEVFSRFGDYINEKNYLGAGTHATCFRYKKHQVLKLCTKEISYFEHFQQENMRISHAEQFKKQINQSN